MKFNLLNTKLPPKVVFFIFISLILAVSVFLYIVLGEKQAPEMFPGGPSGEEAYYQFQTTTQTVPQGQDLLVKILLDSCGGGLCAQITAADVKITYDASKLEPRTQDGSGTATQATQGNLFSSYFQNSISNGAIYIAAYSLPTDANPTYSSEGKSDNEKVFAMVRFRVLSNSGTSKLTVEGSDDTSDSTNIYMKDFNGDIFVKDLNDPAKSGELNLSFTDTNPGSMSLQTANTTVTQGSSFTVDLMADTKNVKTAGYDAVIHFNTSVLRITNVTKNNNLGYNINNIQPVLDNTSGTVRISAGAAPDPGFGGNDRLATLTFSAQNPGTSALDIDFTQNVTTDSNLSFFPGVPLTAETPALDLLGNVNNISVTVNSPAASVEPSPSANPSSEPSPSVNPSTSPSPVPSPSLAPSPTPSYIPSSTYNFKIGPEGLPVGRWNLGARLMGKGTSFQKTLLLNTDGTFSNVDLTGLNLTQTFDFILRIHPYLSAKRTINLSNMPPIIDFGTLRTGDLNQDNQINSLDWSWMRKNFGQNGD